MTKPMIEESKDNKNNNDNEVGRGGMMSDWNDMIRQQRDFIGSQASWLTNNFLLNDDDNDGDHGGFNWFKGLPFDTPSSAANEIVDEFSNTLNGFIGDAVKVVNDKAGQDCQNQGGDPVWDRRGVMRCLFPQLRPDQQDKVFKSYGDFLVWKKQGNKFRESDNVFGRQPPQEQLQQQQVRTSGRSKRVTYETGPDGTTHVKTCETEYLPDGSSKVIENEETLPPGGGIVNDNDNKSSKGWFWS